MNVRTAARILVARPDHLGDVLLTLPAVRALKLLLPAATVSYLVAPGSAAVPARCPDVDETVALPFPPPTAPPSPPGWPDLVAEAGTRLSGRFDLAILPRVGDPWSGAVAVAADVPIRLGFDTPDTRPFLTDALPPPGRQHVVELGLLLARAAARRLGLLGVGPLTMPAGPYLVPTPAEQAEAAAVLRRIGADAAPGPFVLHPGSGWAIKNWPAPRWGTLAAELRLRYGTAPLVVGGPGEGALVEAVVRASGHAAHGLAGRLSIGGLAALQRRARIVIATDGGPLHLAALQGAPVVGLYGPADPLEFGPACPPEHRRIVRARIGCSPCRSLDAPPCRASGAAACVTQIGVVEVLAAVADLAGEPDPASLPTPMPVTASRQRPIVPLGLA